MSDYVKKPVYFCHPLMNRQKRLTGKLLDIKIRLLSAMKRACAPKLPKLSLQFLASGDSFNIFFQLMQCLRS